jgi:iron(III) transport system ATP-binding protein
MSTAIDISALVKQYAPNSPPAVDGVSLKILPGELFFLLGPSGCGKTTLLRMIAGFIDPTGGTIAFATADGTRRDVTHMPPNKRNTGMVFQSYALWPHMTVFDNVAFGLTIRKASKEEIQRRVSEALEMVQMGQYAQRKPNALSGGQQQRVALARALVVRPDVLLLDEPLSNLDAKLRVDLRSEIRRICKDSGITTVYVTHDQKEALSMADRCAIMRKGKVEQLGTPSQLYRSPASSFVAEFLGETNFIEGTIASTSGSSTMIATAAGHMTTHRPCVGAVGSSVKLSLRPETLKMVESQAAGSAGTGQGNRLEGTVVEKTYLGEITQVTIDLGKAGKVRASLLNPPEDLGSSRVALAVDPSDVVVVPS